MVRRVLVHNYPSREATPRTGSSRARGHTHFALVRVGDRPVGVGVRVGFWLGRRLLTVGVVCKNTQNTKYCPKNSVRKCLPGMLLVLYPWYVWRSKSTLYRSGVVAPRRGYMGKTEQATWKCHRCRRVCYVKAWKLCRTVVDVGLKILSSFFLSRFPFSFRISSCSSLKYTCTRYSFRTCQVIQDTKRTPTYYLVIRMRCTIVFFYIQKRQP